jgi:hypothetical protein
VHDPLRPISDARAAAQTPTPPAPETPDPGSIAAAVTGPPAPPAPPRDTERATRAPTAATRRPRPRPRSSSLRPTPPSPLDTAARQPTTPPAPIPASRPRPHGRKEPITAAVIHEWAGPCQGVLRALGCWGAGPLTVVVAGFGAFQSSIRARLRSRVSCGGSGAQSSMRPSGWWRPDIWNELARARAGGSGRGRRQVRGEPHQAAMTFTALARPEALRQRISPSRRP